MHSVECIAFLVYKKMISKTKTLAYFSLILTMFFFSCEDKENENNVADDFDRKALLTDLAEIIEQSYNDYSVQLYILEDATSAFTTDPNESNLQILREAWSQALLKWQYVAPFDFGLAEDVALVASTNVYPVSESMINSNIESGEYNLQSAVNLAAIGLQAIDYMIHGVADTESEIIALYTTDELATNRLEYLNNLVSALINLTNEVEVNWTEGSSQREDFINNDGTSQGSSLGLFLNAFNKSFEKTTRTNKLGIPTGALTFSQNPNPGSVEAFYENDNSIAYLKASVDAFEKIYLGTDENSIGLQEYLVHLDAMHGDITLDEAIIDNIEQLKSGIDNMQNPLSVYLVDQQADALEVYGFMQNLVVLWKVDMMSTLGILITYQDNDGD